MSASVESAPDERVGRRRLIDVVVIWLVSRIVFEAIAVIVAAVHGRASKSQPGFDGLLFNWDSGWFNCILTSGYSGSSCSNPVGARPSFFPGYPLLGRGIAWVFGGGTVSQSSATFALWLIPFLASFGAAYAIYGLAADRYGRATARWAAALLLLGPYGVFLAASYSEALFLVFGISAWWAATRRQYLLAGLLGAAASFTRVNGVFLALGLLVLYFEQQRRAGRPIRIRELLSLAVSLAGAAAFLIWLWAVRGKPDTWLTAQDKYFGRKGSLPWVTLRHQLADLHNDHRLDYRIQELLELVFAVLLVLLAYLLLRRREWGAATFTVLSLLSLMTSTNYLSLARNSITVFPAVLVAAEAIVRSRRRGLIAVCLVIAAAISILNGVQFALGHWAD